MLPSVRFCLLHTKLCSQRLVALRAPGQPADRSRDGGPHVEQAHRNAEVGPAEHDVDAHVLAAAWFQRQQRATRRSGKKRQRTCTSWLISGYTIHRPTTMIILLSVLLTMSPSTPRSLSWRLGAQQGARGARRGAATGLTGSRLGAKSRSSHAQLSVTVEPIAVTHMCWTCRAEAVKERARTADGAAGVSRAAGACPRTRSGSARSRSAGTAATTSKT